MQLSAGAVGRGDSPGGSGSGSDRRRADGLKGAGSAPSAAGGEGRAGLLHSRGLQYSVTGLHELRGVTRPSVQPRRPHAQAP